MNALLTAAALRSHFERALPYDAYVATGSPPQQVSWKKIHDQARLTDAQRTLIASFTRRIHVLVSSGTWCGDCVQQCPLLARIAEASPLPPSLPPLGGTGVPPVPTPSPLISLRFVDRDEHSDLADQIKICGGHRVPTVLFMAEDFEFVSLLGDRTLSRYRAIAARQLGPSCPLPGAPVPPEELAATLQDWVNEFERVHLLLRLSPRLRQLHGD